METNSIDSVLANKGEIIMATKVNIQPVKVLEFPQLRFAHFLLIEKAEVKLKDQGVFILYHLLDEDNSMLYQNGFIELTNEEVATWTTTDEQLIDVVLSKLNLNRIVN